MPFVDKQRIAKTPGVCGGKPCIAGHRIRVMDIVALHEKRGLSAEEIVYQYPSISLADVHAALAYYFDNQQEIQAEFARDLEWAKFAEANYPSILKEKLGG